MIILKLFTTLDIACLPRTYLGRYSSFIKLSCQRLGSKQKINELESASNEMSKIHEFEKMCLEV